MLMVVRKLCGHCAAGPSEVADQSIDLIRLPISPPPPIERRGDLNQSLTCHFVS